MKGERKMWFLWVLCAVILIFLILSFICAFISLYRISEDKDSATKIPATAQYAPYKEEMTKRIEHNKSLPYKTFSIKSEDNKKLFARYYEAKDKTAPLVIFFHGYRSSPFRDSCGAFDFYENDEMSLLLISQRSHENSDGRFLTMGIKERKDCSSWVEFAAKKFPQTEKIILCGVSMGASTVLFSAGEKLNKKVKGIIADCGFSSPKEIMCTVIKSMKLPVKTVYFFIKTGARLFAKTNLDECSVKEQLEKTDIPILFIHGEDDRFVPADMTKECYEAYKGEKYLFTVPRAGHGMSYFVDKNGYKKAVAEFMKKI